MPTNTGYTRIFISYPYVARKKAQNLAEFLEDVGFEVFFKKEAFGKKWENDQVMRISITHSDFVLACFVKKSFINFIFDLFVRHPFRRMKFFEREISHALGISHAKPPENNFLIIGRLEKCRVPKRFKDIPIVDLFEWDGHDKLRECIKAGMNHQKLTFKPYIRFRPRSNLSIHDAMRLIHFKRHFNKDWNDDVDGFKAKYKFDVQQGEKIFVEETTGRMWQRYTSTKFMEANEAQEHVDHINEVEYAGYNDWRLPTLDEALTLMQKQIDKDFFIHPHVYGRQNWILTADQDDGAFWIVNHNRGICGTGQVVEGICVRAVRFFENEG